MNVHAVFNRVYKGQPNFLTPSIIERGQRGDLVWELSTGEGLGDDRLYGVTVIELPGTPRSDLSTCFSSEEVARDYIKNDFQS